MIEVSTVDFKKISQMLKAGGGVRFPNLVRGTKTFFHRGLTRCQQVQADSASLCAASLGCCKVYHVPLDLDILTVLR